MFPGRRLPALVLVVGWLYSACAGAGPPQVSSPGLMIAVHGERLTARIEGASLRRVLAELGRQAGIQSEFIDPADDETVSQAFDEVPLARALQRLLEGRSFVIVQDVVPGAVASAPSLRLVILPRAAAPDGRAATLPQAVAATSVPPDPAPLGAAKGATALDDLTQAMVDPDETVRAHAQELFDQMLVEGTEPSAVGTPRPPR